MIAEQNARPRRAPILIGAVALPNPVLLAPMSGITDAPFRRLVAKHGAGLVISEMTACAALAEGKRHARRRVASQRAGLHVVQLAGCEARWMAEGARIAEASGAATSTSTWAARPSTSPTVPPVRR
jgi:tRNA-dihydrouridine synthase B